MRGLGRDNLEIENIPRKVRDFAGKHRLNRHLASKNIGRETGENKREVAKEGTEKMT